MSSGEMRDPLRPPHPDQQFLSALGFSGPETSQQSGGQQEPQDNNGRLLPPLRRPNCSQIPPDVLAPIVLHAPDHIRNAHLDGNNQGGVKDNNIKKRGWNLNAEEFVPSPSMMDGSNQLALALSNLDVSDEGGFEPEGQTVVLETVTDVIQQLTHNPAEFDRSANDLEATLNQWLSESHMLGITATLIIEQSISHRNFCYSGARLCKHLENVAVGRETFRDVLFKQVQETHLDILAKLKDPDQRETLDMERSKGTAAFFAELFMNFKTKFGFPYGILGLAATELMREIIKADPSPSTVKIMAQTYKLIGWECDNSTNPNLVKLAEDLFKEFTHRMAMGELESVEGIIKSLVALKKRNWDKGGEETDSTAPTYDSCPLYELPESLEDEAFSGEFLEDPNCDGEFVLDDEPDGVVDAYEEFLAGLQK